MRSIRRRLTVWLLGGLAVLWVVAGAGVYLAVRNGLVKSLDAELALDSRIVRFAARGESDTNDEQTPRGRARRLQDRLPAYDEEGSGVFFQMWDAEGNALMRSASLKDRELDFPGEIGDEPDFGTLVLDRGVDVRAMSFRVATGGRGKGKGKGRGSANAAVMVLAKEMDGVQSALNSLLGGIAIIGLVAAAGAVLLVGFALNRGLRPLRELARQTEAIDAESLDARFDGTGAPAELQPVYRRLNGLIHRLETSFERERRFSSDLAHEMRTPVAELKMMSEVALKWPDEAGEKTFAEALEIAGQLETMIETLLALARFESGQSAPKEEVVDLKELLKGVWRPYSSKAEEKGLRVDFDLGEIPSEVESDPHLLRHIFGNLFSNAAEYTPEGGTIRVGGNAVGIGVSNTAPNVTGEDVGHLFDRYWRADAARTDPTHCGLGLSLSRSCAEALGLCLRASIRNGMLEFFLEKSDA